MAQFNRVEGLRLAVQKVQPSFGMPGGGTIYAAIHHQCDSAVLEAVYCGTRALLPKPLSYAEQFKLAQYPEMLYESVRSYVRNGQNVHQS